MSAQEMNEIKQLVLRVAVEAAHKGSGWSQEGVVIREVGSRLAQKGHDPDLATQQAVLEAWHDLFSEKKLAWGFDLDNPNAPFFHVRETN
jgi:hypothetical protein